MRYIILISLIVTVGVSCYWTVSKWTMAPSDLTVPEDMETAWAQHKNKFGLSYNSTEEAYRKGLFAKTHEMIIKHNSDPNTTYQMGHNQFSTMNEAEKKAYLCCHDKQRAAAIEHPPEQILLN